MKKIIKSFTVALLALSVIAGGFGTFLSMNLPDSYQVTEESNLNFNYYSNLFVSTDKNFFSVSRSLDKAINVDIKLFGLIPIKKAKVKVVDEMFVVPSGSSFGMKIFTEGVMLVGMTDVDCDGKLINPARKAGLKIGDIILSINGKKITTNEETAETIEKSGGQKMNFKIKRNDKIIEMSFCSVKSQLEKKYKAGIWVRDSSAGIGTLTFYNPSTGAFAGLGHPICDVDTGKILPVDSGEIVKTKIHSINKGVAGHAGEICGSFVENSKIGKIFANTDLGVYGMLEYRDADVNLMKIALKQEIKTGYAQILTSIDDSGAKYYDCIIERVHFNDDSPTQNMIIRITDKELLQKCGGIVQGMSGSPIIQKNKLVGAVTHVFVNNPDKGYGVFAENMYKVSNNITNNLLKKAS